MAGTIPLTWDEPLGQWDATGPVNRWDPPPRVILGGALLGSGFLDGILVLGVVGLEGELLGTGTLAGQLRAGVVVSGALTGTGLLATTGLLTGTAFAGALRGTGTLAGAFAIPPAGALLGGALFGTGTLTGFLPGVALLIPHLFGPDSPVSQTPHLDENFAAILAQINNAQLLGIGLLAARPAPGRAGALYVVTDQNDEWFVDDGLAWHGMGAFGMGMVVHDLASDNLLLLGAPTPPSFTTHAVTAAKALTIPTQAIIDGAVLYVADTQGVPGRAAWHHLSEAGLRTPLDPVLFRQEGQTVSNTASQVSLFSRTLTGGTLVGRYLEIWWRGDVSNTVAGRSLTLNLWYGNFFPVQLTFTAIPVVSVAPLQVLFRLDGLTGAVQLGVPVAVIGPGVSAISLAAGTVDATVDQSIDIAVTLSVADPGFQLRTLAATMTLR
jgi:hypothetical protein